MRSKPLRPSRLKFIVMVCVPVSVMITSPTSTAWVALPFHTTRNSSAFQVPSAPGAAPCE